jgi:hypothetical protein
VTKSRKHFDEFRPHSRHKHFILKSYFEAWGRKLLLRPGGGTTVCYVDACAGPGIDDAGNHGSPGIPRLGRFGSPWCTQGAAPARALADAG